MLYCIELLSIVKFITLKKIYKIVMSGSKPDLVVDGVGSEQPIFIGEVTT